MTVATLNRDKPRPVPAHVDAIVMEQMAKLDHLDDDALLATLKQAVNLSIENIITAAACVRLFDARGVEVDIDIAGALRSVAYGKLLPDALVHCAAKPSVLRTLKQLPLPDQKTAIDERLPVAEIDDDGNVDFRYLPLLELSARQLKQVFTDDGIRSRDQQAAYLREQRAGDASRRRWATPTTRIDGRRKELVVRVGEAEIRLSRKEILHWASELAK